ncbi:hypothetical protein M0813_14526 [Anaeramoeba flamelloides]|uniref:BZIP domain-containing protein n=1 Tax=Anaeramoeba flamelloides TaxID=1746091 RepID=A0ABQ8Z5S7_9EUKA|nr:hypothetical protein M0813_14526 [Anaeramoeba flamelloides]
MSRKRKKPVTKKNTQKNSEQNSNFSDGEEEKNEEQQEQEEEINQTLKKKTKQINYQTRLKSRVSELEKQLSNLEQENEQFKVKEAILQTKAKIYKEQLDYFQKFMNNAMNFATRNNPIFSLPGMGLSSGVNNNPFSNEKFN